MVSVHDGKPEDIPARLRVRLALGEDPGLDRLVERFGPDDPRGNLSGRAAELHDVLFSREAVLLKLGHRVLDA